jgi:hypothetical protein
MARSITLVLGALRSSLLILLYCMHEEWLAKCLMSESANVLAGFSENSGVPQWHVSGSVQLNISLVMPRDGESPSWFAGQISAGKVSRCLSYL